jgi:hypothetical protein
VNPPGERRPETDLRQALGELNIDLGIRRRAEREETFSPESDRPFVSRRDHARSATG